MQCDEIIPPEELHNPEDDFEDLTDLNLDSPSTPPPDLVKPLQKSTNNKKKVKDEEDFNNSDENNLKPDEMYETVGSKVGSYR